MYLCIGCLSDALLHARAYELWSCPTSLILRDICCLFESLGRCDTICLCLLWLSFFKGNDTHFPEKNEAALGMTVVVVVVLNGWLRFVFLLLLCLSLIYTLCFADSWTRWFLGSLFGCSLLLFMDRTALLHDALEWIGISEIQSIAGYGIGKLAEFLWKLAAGCYDRWRGRSGAGNGNGNNSPPAQDTETDQLLGSHS